MVTGILLTQFIQLNTSRAENGSLPICGNEDLTSDVETTTCGAAATGAPTEDDTVTVITFKSYFVE